MTDVLTKAQRSFNMSRIGAKNTTPEITIRRCLREAGLRGYRIHYTLPGKPDIVFPANRLAVFIDGCFWHKCPIDYREPETRKEFWAQKIARNLTRDREVETALEGQGWAVLRIWEHDVRRNPKSMVAVIATYLRRCQPMQSESHILRPVFRRIQEGA